MTFDEPIDDLRTTQRKLARIIAHSKEVAEAYERGRADQHKATAEACLNVEVPMLIKSGTWENGRNWMSAQWAKVIETTRDAPPPPIKGEGNADLR